MEEEQQLFEDNKGSSKSYRTKSYQALKLLQAAVAGYQEEQRLISEKRVEMAKQMSAQELVEKSKAARASRDEARKVRVSGKKLEKGKGEGGGGGGRGAGGEGGRGGGGGGGGGWMSLNEELQATFAQSLSVRQNAGMVKSVGVVKSVSKGQSSPSKSSPAATLSTFEDALLRRSNFYGSKKSLKTSESQRTERIESHYAKEAHQKKREDLSRVVESQGKAAHQTVQGSHDKRAHHGGGSSRSHQERKALSSSSSASFHKERSHPEQSHHDSRAKTSSKSHWDRGSIKLHQKHQTWEEEEEEEERQQHRESIRTSGSSHVGKSTVMHQDGQSTRTQHKLREKGSSHRMGTSHMILEDRALGDVGHVEESRNMKDWTGGRKKVESSHDGGVKKKEGSHGKKRVDGGHCRVDGGRKIEGSHRKSGGSQKVGWAEGEGKRSSSKGSGKEDVDRVQGRGKESLAGSGRTKGASTGGEVGLERPHLFGVGDYEDNSMIYEDKPASVSAGLSSASVVQSKSARHRLSLSTSKQRGSSVALPKTRTRVLYSRLERGGNADKHSRDKRVGTESAHKSSAVHPSVGGALSGAPCDATSGDVWDSPSSVLGTSSAVVDLSSELFGSDSEGSVVVVSDGSTGGVASPDHSPVSKATDYQPDLDDSPFEDAQETEWGEKLPRKHSPPACVILSSSSDEEDAITGHSGLTFEDALSGMGTSRGTSSKRMSSQGTSSRGMFSRGTSSRETSSRVTSSRGTSPGRSGARAWNSKVKVRTMDAGSLSPVVDSDRSDTDIALDSLFRRKVPSLQLVKAQLNRATVPTRKEDTSQGKSLIPVSHVTGILKQLEGKSFASSDDSSDDSSDGSSVISNHPEDPAEPERNSFSLSTDKLRTGDFDPLPRQTGGPSLTSGRPQKGISSDQSAKTGLQVKKGGSSKFKPGLQAKEAEKKTSSSVSSDRPRKASYSEPVPMAELVPLGRERNRKTSSSSSYEDSVCILTTVGPGPTAKILTADTTESSDPVHKPCGPLISLTKVALQQKQQRAPLHKASLQKTALRMGSKETAPKSSNTRTSQQTTATRTSTAAKPGPTHGPTPRANCAVLKKKAAPPLTSELVNRCGWMEYHHSTCSVSVLVY